MPAALDEAIRQLLCNCFPAYRESFARRRAWHNSVPAYTVVGRVDGRIVGHVAVVLRTITSSSVPVRVAGVQGVAIAPEHRGRGLSRQLMAEALEEAAGRRVPFGLLFCIPELERFYASMGWEKTQQPIAMRDEEGRTVSLPPKNIGMFLSLREESFPPGPLDLEGRDW